MRSPDHPLHDAGMDALCRSMLAAGHSERDVRMACVHALQRFRWEEQFEREAIAELADQQELERTLGRDRYRPPEVLAHLQERWEEADPDWRELHWPSGERPDDYACIYPHWLPDLPPAERDWYLDGEHLGILEALFPRVDAADWATLRVITEFELEGERAGAG